MLSPLQTIDLQDHLLSVGHDLDRLQVLLGDASDSLLAGFHGALADVAAARREGGAAATQATLLRIEDRLKVAIKALQFHDMSSQLLGHTQRRLASCVDTLAREALADDEDGVAVAPEAPLRANPVAQVQMDTGSIELF